ncbi:MAG: hypothetical protein NC092_12515 [Butyrivibrio sp.]|nr:hypothetical protein [Muribaculum sp.]MCM1553499.1 hypothetical protein [Butyrivibrio sp.]
MLDRMQTYLNILNAATQIAKRNLDDRVAANGKIKMSGTEFEQVVKGALQEAGIKAEQISHSPQKFPDYVITDDEAEITIGIEVKKTDSDKWEIQGGSIYESLKNDVDDTFVFMGKFGGKEPEVRLKRYKECWRDLKVTHSPRIYLDLDIPAGEDYITRNDAEDLLELSGEDLNRRIRELLRTDKSTWWSEDKTTSYADLSPDEKDVYLNDGIALFPEVFGSDYDNFAQWMMYGCLVWCTCVRDIFSAGGVVLYQGVYFSAVMYRTIENIDLIVKRITNMSKKEVERYWHVDDETDGRIGIWVDLVQQNLKISNQLIKKNQTLERFKNMPESEVESLISEEFIHILRKYVR